MYTVHFYKTFIANTMDTLGKKTYNSHVLRIKLSTDAVNIYI